MERISILPILEELQEIATITDLSNDTCSDEELIFAPAPTDLISPSSKLSVLINLSDLSRKSSQALKKCGHVIQTLTYNNLRISVFCQLCNANDFDAFPSKNEDANDILIIDSEVISKSKDCQPNNQPKHFDERNILTLEEIDGQETESKVSFRDTNICNVKDSIMQNLDTPNSESKTNISSTDDVMSKDPGPILLFDTRLEVKTKQKCKVEDGLEDIDVSLLSPVVEIKEESGEAKGKTSSSDIPCVRIRPLSQLLKESDLSYDTSKLQDEEIPVKNIPVIDLDDDDDPPTTVDPIISLPNESVRNLLTLEQLAPMDTEAKSRHENHGNYTSNQLSLEGQLDQYQHNSIGQSSYQFTSSFMNERAINDFPLDGSSLKQTTYRVESSPVGNQRSLASPIGYANHKLPPIVPPGSRMDSPGTIQRLSAQNKVAINNLLQKSRQYQVSGQFPSSQNFSPTGRSQTPMSRTPYFRTTPRPPFQTASSTQSVHPGIQSQSLQNPNVRSYNQSLGSPAMDLTQGRNQIPTVSASQPMNMSPVPYPVSQGIGLPNSSQRYPIVNSTPSNLSTSPGISLNKEIHQRTNFNMNQKYPVLSSALASQTVAMHSLPRQVNQGSSRFSSATLRTPSLNYFRAPSQGVSNRPGNLIVMVQVTGVGPQSTPLYLYDQREPLPPGYQAVPVDAGWRPTFMQKTEKGIPVVLTDPQGRQISTGEELLFIKYGMKRL